MKAKIVYFALATLAATTIVCGCNKGYNTTTTGNAVYSNMGTGAMASVTIQNMAFMPDSLNIKTGATVTWSNMDNVTYSIDELSGQFSSGDIMPGQLFQYIFMDPGTFTYRNSMSTVMKAGVVVVTN